MRTLTKLALVLIPTITLSMAALAHCSVSNLLHRHV